MNKKIIKTLMLIWILVCGFQQVAYADIAYVNNPLNDVNPIIIVGIFAGISLVVLIAISFLATLSSKRQVKDENGIINEEKFQVGKKEFEDVVYLMIIAFSIIVFGISFIYWELNITLVVCCLLFAFFTFFIRIFSRKISNMLCIGFIAILTVIAIFFMINDFDSFLFNKKIENDIYEENDNVSSFFKYIGNLENVGLFNKINNMEELVEKVDKYNKGKNHITIMYLNKKYMTSDELNDFLDEIENEKTDKAYYLMIKNDYTNNENGDNNFIFWISKYYHILDDYNDFPLDSAFVMYEGKILGSQVRSLLDLCKKWANTYYEDHPERIPSISYNSISGGKDCNSFLAAYIIDVKEDGTKEIIKGDYAPIGVEGIDSVTKYNQYLDLIDSGLDLNHRYNVVYTGNSDGVIAGITINYDENSNIENFEPSYDEKNVNGVVSTTGLEIDCLR